MCLVTSSPPPGRSSISSRSSSSISSSSGSRRVSFNATVKVYDLEPMEKDVSGMVYYSSNDYRRFRSDSCLEILDQQLQSQPQNGWNVVWQKVFNALALKAVTSTGYQRRKQRTSMPEVDYPWLTPYHPHEEEELPRQQQQAPSSTNADPVIRVAAVVPTKISPPPSPPKSSSDSDTAREKRLIQELAFCGLAG